MTQLKTVAEIFWLFLILGCISFGGPVAHIGYFQRTFVAKLAWLNDDAYAKLVALSQFLPGPGSSQVGFGIGLHRAGLMGGIAAFLGFTLPSFLLMYCLAVSVNLEAPPIWLDGVTTGLKLLAVVVVFDAIQNMFRQFCKNISSILITFCCAALLIVANTFFVQIALLIVAGAIGILTNTPPEKTSVQPTKTNKLLILPLVVFVSLFALSLLSTHQHSLTGLLSSFYHSGSLVFGGGHVVLPLLQTRVEGTLTEQQFIFAYASAQGVPGPMFTIATFLGAKIYEPHAFLGATLATIAIFLPGLLLVLSFKNAWQSVSHHPKLQGLSCGLNAAVVGFLAAAFYQPIYTSAIVDKQNFIAALLGLLALKVAKAPILLLLALFLAYGVTKALIFL